MVIFQGLAAFFFNDGVTALMPQFVTEYLDSKITEISYTMATVLMLFAGDYLTEVLIIKNIRNRNLLARTGLFLGYTLLALPMLTVASARALESLVLEPLQGYLWILLLVFFLFSGVLLSLKYRMKLF
jgi:peptidoglycan/LPS O-acetylase OafA/YrhL